jgi:hypothetical protein
MSFSKQIGAFSIKAKKNIDRTRRGTALSMFGKIVERTPVGNPSLWKTKYPPKGYAGGRLRANWQASIGAPKDGIIDSTSEQKSRSSIDRAVAMLKGDQAIYLSNNLPYAQVIEDGNSQQAPFGMVKVVLRAFRMVVSKQARENKR